MGIIKKEYNKNYFENILYKETTNSQRNKNRLKEILKHKNKGKLLEIGCGKGEFLKLAKNYFDIEGIDISKYAINSIKPIFNNKVHVKDIEKESLILNNYDIIIIFNLLEHIKEPSSIIKKIYNSLKKDGILFGSVPHNYSLIGTSFTRLTNFLDKTHCSVYPPKQWHKLFKEVSFKEITFFGEIIFNRNKNKYIKNKIWKHLSFNLMFLCKK